MSRLPLTILALALVLGPTTQQASADSLDILMGRYTFNWFGNLNATRCAKITRKLFKELRSPNYKCELHEITNTASGHPAVVCTKTDKSNEYLIFKSRAMCEEERTTQASNE